MSIPEHLIENPAGCRYSRSERTRGFDTTASEDSVSSVWVPICIGNAATRPRDRANPVIAAYFVPMVGRLALSPIVPDIAADLEISNSLIGGAVTAMWITYALVQFPSDVLGDRFEEHIVIQASVAGTGFTTLVIASASRYGFFVLGTDLPGAATDSVVGYFADLLGWGSPSDF